MKELWTEKYRPKTVKEYVFRDEAQKRQVQTWLQGVKWARDYDLLLRLSDDQKRQRREQDERNRQLVMRLKNEKSELKNERTN